jgi:hypothetical protein
MAGGKQQPVHFCAVTVDLLPYFLLFQAKTRLSTRLAVVVGTIGSLLVASLLLLVVAARSDPSPRPDLVRDVLVLGRHGQPP